MKRKNVAVMLSILSAMTIICGCSGNVTINVTPDEPVEDLTEVEQEEAEDDVEDTEAKEDYVGISNPWIDADSKGIEETIGVALRVPDGATDVSYHLETLSNLAEVIFTYDGLEYCERAQKSNEYKDISGLYYEWDVELESDIHGCKGVEMGASDDMGMTRVCMWYDEAAGIMYSLSTSSEDLDGYDIVAIVDMIYVPDEDQDTTGEAGVKQSDIDTCIQSFISWSGMQYFYEDDVVATSLTAQQAVPMAALAAQSMYVDDFELTDDGCALLIDAKSLEASMKALFGKTYDLDEYDDEVAKDKLVTKNEDGTVNLKLGDWGTMWPDCKIMKVTEPDADGRQKVYVSYFATCFEPDFDNDFDNDLYYYAIYTIRENKESYFGLNIEDYVASYEADKTGDYAKVVD